MQEILIEFFQKFTDNGKLITLITSMFPLIELKGAIPVGALLGVDFLTSAVLAYIGSSIISVPLFFLLIPIFNLLKKIKFIKRFIEKIEQVFKDKAADFAKKHSGETEAVQRKMLSLGLFVFVAIPLPITGIWTGTAIAVFLNMSFKDSVLPLVLGNLVAGTIITLLTFFFKAYVDIIILVLAAIAVIMLFVLIIKIIKSKPHGQDNIDE